MGARSLRSFLETTFPEMMESMPEAIQSVTPIVVPWSLPLAFGLYPANRAAAMNPIEALLHVA